MVPSSWMGSSFAIYLTKRAPRVKFLKATLLAPTLLMCEAEIKAKGMGHKVFIRRISFFQLGMGQAVVPRGES